MVRGLSEKVVLELAQRKKEPKWVTDLRLKALKAWEKLEMPNWGPKLDGLHLDQIETYIKPQQEMVKSWTKVPKEIRETFEKLGIPEAERAALGGVGAQYNSEMIYFRLKKQVEARGVVYLPMEEAIRSRRRLLIDNEWKEVRSLVREYFMKIVPSESYKFMALHGAVWSGGSFIYVPKKAVVEVPLQAYYRLNAPGAGQFEHSLIIVDEEADLSFIEGCSAPRYNVANLHVGCVEVMVKKGARLKFATVDSWSKNVFNLSTKRALVDERGMIDWVTGSFGSQVSMLYPTTILRGEGAKMTFKGISMAGSGQNLDTGMRVVHLAHKTCSNINLKSLIKDGGISTTRSFVKIAKEARGVRNFLDCQSLILDEKSRADAVPEIKVLSDEAEVGHEAAVGQISEEEIFYLKSRGLSEEQARVLVVRGFTEGVVSELPVEYAREMNRLIELEIQK